MKHIQFSFDTHLTDIDTLILPVTENGDLPPTVTNLPNLSELAKFAKAVVDAEDFSPKTGKTQLFINSNGLPIKRLVLVGVGDIEKLSKKSYLSLVEKAVELVTQSPVQTVINALVFVSPAGIEEDATAWSIMQNTLSLQKSLYQYNHESRGDFEAKDVKLREVIYPCASNDLALDQGQSTALGMELTQDLANMPSNFCTPTYLAETAQSLAENYGFDVNVLEREQMIEMGMGSFMSVAQGSVEPPKMICLSYKGGHSDDAPIALVGKGVTFDTGGISLKPGAAMDEMKYDMGGAATVLGVFKALGELKPKLNVVAVIPATENMPAGNATKPGDVVRSLSGQTIEILNTDAEGRLILCDALTYVQQTYEPAKIIDMATLTGACIIALGHHVSAVLGNNQSLIDDLLSSGESTYDRFWQMPLGDEWDEQLKSNFADMANIGGRPAGTITAAQFLSRFTKEVDWAHLDIAGTAWVSGANKGATGRPVPALVDFLLKQA